jgi:LmbE family N-acetylglucosaminyl deacetylase
MTRADMTRPAKFLFVSPHLDDAVFGCGALIASCSGAVVTTVFAGRPAAESPLTCWDAECGFRAGDDVIGVRRAEDREALAHLDAHPIWLDYRDDQYGDSPDADELEGALAALIDTHAFEAVFIPLGLFHADHERVSDAVIALAQPAGARWYAYEDAIYRRIPGAVRRRIETLRSRGHALTRQEFPTDDAARSRKDEAVACYRSQLTALAKRPALADTQAPETYWRIERA